MSYESPIEINYGEMQTAYENGILKVVWKYDIHCDKEELLKALAYDRDQYRKGYEDAQRTGKWLEHSDNWYQTMYRCSECGKVVSNMSNYCPDCGARMESDTW